MDIIHQLLTILVPVMVPYLTQGVHELFKMGLNRTPPLLKWAFPMLVGNITASVATATGIPLPAGLDHISTDQLTQILLSGTTLGLIGMALHDGVDALKKTFPPESVIGKIINAIAGAHSDSQLSVHPDNAPQAGIPLGKP